MNGLNKRRKATSVSTFDFSTLYTKLSHNKLLMVLNSLIDFCFDGGECQYITVNNYQACWVNNVKDNVICLTSSFFANLFLYFYKSKWMNELKKSDLIKARKLCNIFRFIDDLNSTNDGGEFESNYSNIYPEELQLDKENTDKHETSFLDLNIKIKDESFILVSLIKEIHFLFLLSECQTSQVMYHLV